MLRLLGVEFVVAAADIDEALVRGESASAYVKRLAAAKASAVRERHRHAPLVLAADTTVAIKDRLFGKPDHYQAAAEMLGTLSAAWHEVYTGLALHHGELEERVICTRVKFRAITTAEIAAYWHSGEPQDKAGAYAIQGLGGAFVERIDGSYSNVVGLPLTETVDLLNKHGVAHRLNSGAEILSM